MEIYVDILILENIIIVYFLLSVTFKFVSVEIRKRRKILSSIIGGLYTVVMIIPEIKFLSKIPIQVAIVVVMVAVCVGVKKVSIIVKGSITFLLSSFLLSGLCFSLSIWQNEFKLSSPYTMVDYSIKYLIFAIIVLYFVIDRVTTIIKDRGVISNFIYDVEIISDGEIYEVKAFLDTGNELREPITNLPCILIEEKYIEKLMGKTKNTYYIPYSSIGYDGKLIGVKIDKVRISRKKGEYKELKAIICPCKNTLSKEGDYYALLSRGVI